MDWILLVLTGCTMPPDLMIRPEPGPPPVLECPAGLSGDEPIASKILEEARSAIAGDPSVILLENGEDALLTRIHLLRAARSNVDIQVFIYTYDRTGKFFFSELLKAAGRGVRVRLLVDHIYSPGISPAEYASLATAHANLEIKVFRPIANDAVAKGSDFTQGTFMRFSSMNYRMHNKVMLVDGALAIVGGRNIQDAYYDRDPKLTFLDRDIIVNGPVCQDIHASFEEFWEHKDSFHATQMSDIRRSLKKGQRIDPGLVLGETDPTFTEVTLSADLWDITDGNPSLKSWPVEEIVFLADVPVKATRFANPWKQNPFEEVFALMEEADEEILMQTPYAVMEDKTYRRLRKIRKKKPEVRFRISTNSLSSSDHFYVSGIALKQRRMQIEGLRTELYLIKPIPGDIGEYVPGYENLLQQASNSSNSNPFSLSQAATRFCVHGKSLIIDRKLSLVGSHNFDPRSVYLNSECLVLIRDSAFSRHLAEVVDKAIHPRNSWVVAPRNLPPIIGDLNGLLARISSNLPMFDLWPIEQVSCYELKEGLEPLSPYDSDFHSRYRDVGPIPGLDIGMEQVRIQLIRAFGGPMTPLM